MRGVTAMTDPKAIREARENVLAAISALKDGFPVEQVNIELHHAARNLKYALDANQPAPEVKADPLREALQKIADLSDSEAGEPLDDAIEIARAALAAPQPPAPITTEQHREAIARIIGGNIFGSPDSSVGPATRSVRQDAFAKADAILALAPQERGTRETEIVRLIEVLRSDEGDSVTILCDNPDFNGQPNCAIVCNGDWTGWVDKRFAADSVLDALSMAMVEKSLPSPRKVIATSNGHHWIERFNLVCCRDCGFVRRDDDQNSPCKGPVGVGIRMDLATAPVADRAAVIEECARIIEHNQEQITETSSGSQRSLSPRMNGNQMGLAYATGIRALADAKEDRK